MLLASVGSGAAKCKPPTTGAAAGPEWGQSAPTQGMV